jgi:hypothetical protein
MVDRAIKSDPATGITRCKKQKWQLNGNCHPHRGELSLINGLWSGFL